MKIGLDLTISGITGTREHKKVINVDRNKGASGEIREEPINFYKEQRIRISLRFWNLVQGMV